jgi:hypothetical protein
VAMMANKKALFALWIVSLDLKPTEASFLPNLTDSLCLRVAQVPRSRDMAIFGLVTTMTTVTRPIPFSLAHAHSVVNVC